MKKIVQELNEIKARDQKCWCEIDKLARVHKIIACSRHLKYLDIQAMAETSDAYDRFIEYLEVELRSGHREESVLSFPRGRGS